MSERDTAYSFVKVSELKDYMSGIGLDADQASASQDVVDGVQRELERHCQRYFTRRVRTEALYPDEFGRLWPKAVPVVSVSSPLGLTTEGGNPNALVGAVGGGYWGSSAPVLVTYIGGLDPDGDDLHDVRVAILRVASREVSALHSDVLDPNDLSARPARDRDNRVLGWTDDELRKFDRLRRRTVV